MSTNTGVAAGRPAPGLVLERGDSTPNTVAMRVLESGVWVEYGWSDVARTVARVSKTLQKGGVTTGAEVAVVCGSRAEWAPSIWAVNALGATAIAVSSQAAEATLQSVAERRPGMWILEGLEALDRVSRCDTGDAAMLIIDPVELPSSRAGIRTWQHDVVDAIAADDHDRIAELRGIIAAIDPDTPALRLPQDHDLVFSHGELQAGGVDAPDDSVAPLALESGDEYLAFLPPSWASEAVLLLGSHPASGATVSVGSRVGGGLAELTFVHPTVVQAPAEWWDAVAERVLRSAAEPAPLARKAMEQVTSGESGGGFIANLARRSITRSLGLERIRAARSFGSVTSATAAVCKGLNVPLDQRGTRPGDLVTVDQSSNPTNFEEAK